MLQNPQRVALQLRQANFLVRDARELIAGLRQRCVDGRFLISEAFEIRLNSLAELVLEVGNSSRQELHVGIIGRAA